jgi:tetratricopeptide (TPR) repeat protein
MARRNSTVSKPPVPVDAGKKIRDWTSLILSIVGATLGLLGFLNSRDSASLTRRLEAQALLNEVWDMLGGDKEGVGELNIDKLNDSPYDLEKARRKIDRAKQLAPNYAAVYWTESSLAYARGNIEKSIALNRQAIRLDPTSSIPHNRLGTALVAQHQLDQAAAEFQSATLLDPNDPAPLANLCFVNWKLGKLSKASAECEQALRIDPSMQITYDNLAAVRLAQGRISEANALLLKKPHGS